MKKTILFFAGCAFFLASCGNNSQPQGQSKEQVDSSVNAQVAAKEAAIKSQNDSTIKAEADAKAKQMEREHEGEKRSEKKHGEKASATPTPPPPPPPSPVNNRPGASNAGAKNVNDRSGAH